MTTKRVWTGFWLSKVRLHNSILEFCEASEKMVTKWPKPTVLNGSDNYHLMTKIYTQKNSKAVCKKNIPKHLKIMQDHARFHSSTLHSFTYYLCDPWYGSSLLASPGLSSTYTYAFLETTSLQDSIWKLISIIQISVFEN